MVSINLLSTRQDDDRTQHTYDVGIHLIQITIGPSFDATQQAFYTG